MSFKFARRVPQASHNQASAFHEPSMERSYDLLNIQVFLSILLEDTRQGMFSLTQLVLSRPAQNLRQHSQP
ncbi:hypothetical protein BDW69DRAFT_176634 [Aspergillus filifer]